MEGLKYTVIDSREKYFDYCNKLEQLIFSESNNKEMEDEIKKYKFKNIEKNRRIQRKTKRETKI